MIRNGESSAASRARELILRSKAATTGGGCIGQRYTQHHSARWDYLLAACIRSVPRRDSAVLDVGRSKFSSMLAMYYTDLATMGFAPEVDDDAQTQLSTAAGRVVEHIIFDLNRSQDPTCWPETRKFDLIVCAEVLEHLFCAPELVFLFFRSILAVDGTFIVQTPNAVALRKRIKMILGIHPFERIRCYDRNPGHHREYTRAELIDIGELCGFALVSHSFVDYFGCDGSPAKRAAGRLWKLIGLALPSCREGQTAVYCLGPKP